MTDALVWPMCRGPEGPGAMRITTSPTTPSRSGSPWLRGFLSLWVREGSIDSSALSCCSGVIELTSSTTASMTALTDATSPRSSGHSPSTFPRTALGLALPLWKTAFCSAYFLIESSMLSGMTQPCISIYLNNDLKSRITQSSIPITRVCLAHVVSSGRKV